MTSAILVPKDSAIKTVADLKGKKVAFNKGSNVHYLLVRALEKAGLKYSDIESVFLAPADARAAFERGSIHAWAIWDPFQAAAEAATGARTLADGSGIVANHQFYLAAEKFADGNPQVLDALLDQLREVDAWAKRDIKAVAEHLSRCCIVTEKSKATQLTREIKAIKEGTLWFTHYRVMNDAMEATTHRRSAILKRKTLSSPPRRFSVIRNHRGYMSGSGGSSVI